MAWNEDGNGKDPWKRDGGEPKELDQIVQDWQKRFGSILGGGRGGGSGAGGIALIVLLLIAWGLTGLYRVDAAERGVVQRFGEYMEPVTMPGLRWHLPFPIETVDIVNIEQVNADFFERLNQIAPDLTASEKQICALLRLNLSNKEIASIRNISPKSGEMARYRLRKKLPIKAGDDIYTFIQNI